MMKKLKWIALALLVCGVAGAWYGYSEWNRKPADLTDMKASMEMSATDLIKAFSEDETKANEKYTAKDVILAVKSKIISIDKDAKGLNTIMLGSETDLSSVSCQMDSLHNADAEKLQPGQDVTVKGICTGFLTDVILVRCVIQK